MRFRADILLFSFSLLSCKEAPPEPPQGQVSTVQLSFEDAGVTDVWLRLTFTDAATPHIFALQRDGASILSGALLAQDTLLVDTAALPKRSYNYKAYRISNGVPTESSPTVRVATMDTTDHEFIFVIDTVGDGNSSALYDLAIINDTLAYAVGEIYKRDTVGNWDPLPYNLVRWNGQGWKLARVTVSFRGNLITPPIYGIQTFSATDIWLASGLAIHGDGTSWIGYDVRAITGYDTLSFTKCWGEISSDMYYIGLQGSFAFYANRTWQRVQTGTTLALQDIWGGSNTSGGGMTVLCVASWNTRTQGNVLFQVRPSSVSSLSDNGLPGSLRGIWFIPERKYYIVGDGVFDKRSLNDGAPWHRYPPGTVTNYFSNSVHGQALNDVVVAGAFGEVAHFNGVTWRNYTPVTGLASGSYYRVDIKGNDIFAVGDLYDKAVVLHGKR